MSRNSQSISTKSLPTKVLWATPTVSGNFNRKGASKASGDGLRTQVAQKQVAQLSTTETLSADWVETLMGFPMGWTSLTDGQIQEIKSRRHGNRKERRKKEVSQEINIDFVSSETLSSHK